MGTLTQTGREWSTGFHCRAPVLPGRGRLHGLRSADNGKVPRHYFFENLREPRVHVRVRPSIDNSDE
jgi:hypothetical protein